MRYFTIAVRNREYTDGEIVISKPRLYRGSVQTPSNYRDIQAYGERITDKKKIILKNELVIKRDCKGKTQSEINNGDLVYVYTKPDGETLSGEKADYVVESVIIGNIYCEIVCNKIIK